MFDNKKGALLVIAIIAFYTGIVSLLQVMAIRNSTASGIAEKLDTYQTRIDISGFTVTAYCPGKCCNGRWAGLTATGKSIGYYKSRKINIAAVDPSVISLGSNFIYGGTVYHAVDIGGKIKGRRIDILLPDHAKTVVFGVKKNQSITIIDSKKNISRSNDKKSAEVL